MDKTTFRLLSLILAMALLLPGCQGGREPTKAELGGVLGGVAGGVLGSRFGKGAGKTAATVAGALVGVAAGSYMGSRMDTADRYEMNQALETNPTGKTTAWKNPDTGGRYEVTPVRTVHQPRGRDAEVCREFVSKVLIGGKHEEAYGTACRKPDGSWQIVSMDERDRNEW
jgi:surface antigen